MAPSALLIGHLRASIQDCLSFVYSGYLMEKMEASIPFSWSPWILYQIVKWRRKRLFYVRGGTSKSIHCKSQLGSSRYSSVNAHLLSAETKRQHHPKDCRDIRQIFSPYPRILCHFTRLGGMKRLNVNALYCRASHVLNLQSSVAKDRNKEQVLLSLHRTFHPAGASAKSVP